MSRRSFLPVLSAAVVLLLPASLHAGWIYVRVATGNDSNPGTSASPVKTITKGLMLATSGDTVRVYEGTYNAAAGEVFPIVMKSGVRLIGDRGAVATIIDAGGANRVMELNGTADSTLVEGFTIRNGAYTTESTGVGGAGIYIHGGDRSTIRNNWIIENQLGGANGGIGQTGVGGCGGGLFVAGSAPSIYNNVFRSNIVRGGNGGASAGGTVPGPAGAGAYARGGGLCALAMTGGTVVNNTFFANQVFGGNSGPSLGFPAAGGSGAGAGMYSAGVIVANNIFMQNVAVGGSGFPPGIPSGPLEHSGSTPMNNLFFANSPEGGTTGSAAVTGQDPLFADPPEGLDLVIGSPAIGRGLASVAPLKDLDGWTRANPPSIGAYEPTILRTRNAGDLNGDGNVDAVAKFTGGDAIGAYYCDLPTVTFGIVGWSETHVVAGTGDIDGDGDSDVLLLDSSGGLGAWLMSGFAVTGARNIGHTAYSAIVASEDFDGDGIDDILFRDMTGTLGVWMMNNGYVASGGAIGSTGDYDVVAVADFDNDGKADIVLRDELGNIGMWMMNGTVITSGALVGSPGEYTVAAAADFNGDGFADILLQDNLGSLGLWFMNGSAIVGGGFVGTPGEHTVPLVGDFNGDGRADIVLRAPDGNIGVWLMDGATIVGGQPLSTAASDRFEYY